MDKLPNETNAQWCERVAASIPAAELTEIVMKARVRKSRAPRPGELWSFVGMVSGHGSGVSSAIVKRWEVEQAARKAREAAVGARWFVVTDHGSERDFGRGEVAVRENVASRKAKGLSARLYRMTPTEVDT